MSVGGVLVAIKAERGEGNVGEKGESVGRRITRAGVMSEAGDDQSALVESKSLAAVVWFIMRVLVPNQPAAPLTSILTTTTRAPTTKKHHTS